MKNGCPLCLHRRVICTEHMHSYDAEFMCYAASVPSKLCHMYSTEYIMLTVNAICSLSDRCHEGFICCSENGEKLLALYPRWTYGYLLLIKQRMVPFYFYILHTSLHCCLLAWRALASAFSNALTSLRGRKFVCLINYSETKKTASFVSSSSCSACFSVSSSKITESIAWVSSSVQLFSA
jgi:hypothetical protein